MEYTLDGKDELTTTKLNKNYSYKFFVWLDHKMKTTMCLSSRYNENSQTY